jgi:hypothetical protein
LNWAENYQPVNELYQIAEHPALSPDFGHPERRVKTADKFGRSGITTWKTRGMISPNLHDIWAMFFLILSRYETLVLLILIRTSGHGYSR